MNTINLSFTSDSLHLIELNSDKEIVYIDELEYNVNLKEDLFSYNDNEVVISELADKISRVLGSNKNTKAAVLIETIQTFLNIIPVNFNEDKSSINSHILWELSNYYPETYKNFEIKYYRLNNIHIDNNIDEALLIAVDKNRIQFIKKVCKESSLNVKIIDIDHFAVERFIREIYPELSSENIFLVGCKKNRIDFSLIVSGKLKYYDFVLINNRNVKSLISKQLKFLYSYFSGINIKKIFIYGNGNANEVKKYFDESGRFDSEYLNPFKKFKFREEPDLDERSLSKFAPVFGLALKSFNN